MYIRAALSEHVDVDVSASDSGKVGNNQSSSDDIEAVQSVELDVQALVIVAETSTGVVYRRDGT